MTEVLFHDAYLKTATAKVTAHSDAGGVILDRSIFYPTGGGQPGDAGHLEWNGAQTRISMAVKGQNGAIVLMCADGAQVPPIGSAVAQHLDWEQRHRFMRVHTALHLLSVVIPLPVTGGQISCDKGRLDFQMPEAPEDKQAIEDTLNELIAQDLIVSDSWITDAELAAKPEMVKTMSVKPPTGAGHVRLVRIGLPDFQIDLQPCGGTHVTNTSEIGAMRLGKIENKGKQNRRVNIHLIDV
ncbi:MAG: misacylated tRNA(Ala) deacylase [Paracoccaceae bacterium]|jgi:misacylated tRNA(Ala) deacylase